ncbi:hypothetical protein Q3H58_000774 [Pseudomonas psychrotolerans]|nr:hypothetical protein [Pseudomonas psychrotolerans]
MAGKTLYDKLWDMHLVKQRDDGSALLYIDRHIIHEVTLAPGLRRPASGRPQALAPGRQPRDPRPQRADHPGSQGRP